MGVGNREAGMPNSSLNSLNTSVLGMPNGKEISHNVLEQISVSEFETSKAEPTIYEASPNTSHERIKGKSKLVGAEHDDNYEYTSTKKIKISDTAQAYNETINILKEIKASINMLNSDVCEKLGEIAEAIRQKGK
ncbi:uncharacterized protein LOC115886944 [Sitophilus oryzae]|uniref:Uncharacterized protein LOC115886944 n=1 Tax=Sitophilus oryzae TaxID=7048 RepID=A0A6J2YE15_SITOR|nr:uncharacterized protein LOC115886944 [Sitophilus oryzae]